MSKWQTINGLPEPIQTCFLDFTFIHRHSVIQDVAFKPHNYSLYCLQIHYLKYSMSNLCTMENCVVCYLLTSSNPYILHRKVCVNELTVKTFSRNLACQNTRHIHTLHILTIRKQMYTTICTHAWQSDRALSVWWQYRILAWLRWRRQRQEWNCQQLGVTGSWDGEDGKRDSKVDGTQSLCPSVYLTLPRPCASLFHPPLFSFVLSYHSF